MWSGKRFQELLNYINDGALKADFQGMTFPDIQKSPLGESLAGRPSPREITVQDFGSTEIYDFCSLPGGRSLIALGEAGVRVISRKGKIIRHFDIPAHSLVVSDLKNRALALSPRGDVYRISRIYLDEPKAEYWLDANLDQFADTFDGAIWFISVGNNLYAIDVHAKSLKSFWHVSKLPGPLKHLARSANNLAFVGFEEDHLKFLWRYDLPQFILRERSDIDELRGIQLTEFRVTPAGTIKAIYCHPVKDAASNLHYYQKQLHKKATIIPLDIMPGTIHPATISEKWFSLPVEYELGVVVYLIDSKRSKYSASP